MKYTALFIAFAALCLSSAYAGVRGTAKNRELGLMDERFSVADLLNLLDDHVDAKSGSSDGFVDSSSGGGGVLDVDDDCTAFEDLDFLDNVELKRFGNVCDPISPHDFLALSAPFYQGPAGKQRRKDIYRAYACSRSRWEDGWSQVTGTLSSDSYNSAYGTGYLDHQDEGGDIIFFENVDDHDVPAIEFGFSTYGYSQDAIENQVRFVCAGSRTAPKAILSNELLPIRIPGRDCMSIKKDQRFDEQYTIDVQCPNGNAKQLTVALEDEGVPIAIAVPHTACENDDYIIDAEQVELINLLNQGQVASANYNIRSGMYLTYKRGCCHGVENYSGDLPSYTECAGKDEMGQKAVVMQAYGLSDIDDDTCRGEIGCARRYFSNDRAQCKEDMSQRRSELYNSRVCKATPTRSPTSAPKTAPPTNPPTRPKTPPTRPKPMDVPDRSVPDRPVPVRDRSVPDRSVRDPLRK